MAATLEQILAEIKKNTKALSDLNQRLGKVEKSVGSLDKDMKKVLKCVSTENADFKISVSKGGGSQRSYAPMAAKAR